MAVTLTNEVLAHAMRITPTPTTTLTTEQTVTVTRLLSAATSMVDNYASGAPDDVANEAVIRLAGWMHDSPPGRQNADALGLSGARSMLGPWRVRRAYGLEDTTACRNRRCYERGPWARYSRGSGESGRRGVRCWVAIPWIRYGPGYADATRP